MRLTSRRRSALPETTLHSGHWHRRDRRAPKPVRTARSFAFLPAAQKVVRCACILAGFHRTRPRGFCEATTELDGDAEIEFSLPSVVALERNRMVPRICSPTAPQVRTLRRVSSWISLQRESDASRSERHRLGLDPKLYLGQPNGNGTSQRARFNLGPRLPGEKAFLERGSPRFWGAGRCRPAAAANRRPDPNNELALSQ